MRRIYGVHLLIDGYVNSSSSLEPGPIFNLFDKLVPSLNMQYLQPPVATRVLPDASKLLGDEDEGGWSVFCQITTSHIAIHGWPLRKAFMMDVFSCKPFDTDCALYMVREGLGVKDCVSNVVMRRGPTLCT